MCTYITDKLKAKISQQKKNKINIDHHKKAMIHQIKKERLVLKFLHCFDQKLLGIGSPLDYRSHWQ